MTRQIIAKTTFKNMATLFNVYSNNEKFFFSADETDRRTIIATDICTREEKHMSVKNAYELYRKNS